MDRNILVDETLDDLLHGQLKLLQKRRGYRYSVDALLLADFVLPAAGEDVIDLGTGSGVIPLLIAARGQARRLVGVEIQRDIADMARRSVVINRLADRIEIINADIRELSLPDHSFNLVLSNPPFRPLGQGQISPRPDKALARHEIALTLEQLLYQAIRLIRPSGRICIIFPIDQRDRLKNAIGEAGIFIARDRMAAARPDGEPRLIMIEARSLRPEKIIHLPDVAIETDQGKFSLDGYK